MSQTWVQDPKTGDYVMNANGTPRETNSLLAPAYIRTKASRNQWQYAPDDQWGSDFYLLKKRGNLGDSTQVENTEAQALQPMVDDGRASSMEVTTTSKSINGVAINVKIFDQNGDVEQENFVGLGVV